MPSTLQLMLCKNLEMSCSYFHNCPCPRLLLLVLVVSSISLPKLFQFDNKHLVGGCGGGGSSPVVKVLMAQSISRWSKVLVGVSRSRGCCLHSHNSQLCFGIHSFFLVLPLGWISYGRPR